MDSKQAIELLHNRQYQKHVGNGKYEYIHELTDADVKNVESVIQRQDKSISDLQARLREMDEKNRTQAQVLAARCEIIERQSAKCETCFDNYAKVIGKLTERAESAEANVERQERMIEMACAEWEQVAECNDCLAARTCTVNAKGECATEYRRWLEQEAQHD